MSMRVFLLNLWDGDVRVVIGDLINVFYEEYGSYGKDAKICSVLKSFTNIRN